MTTYKAREKVVQKDELITIPDNARDVDISTEVNEEGNKVYRVSYLEKQSESIL